MKKILLTTAIAATLVASSGFAATVAVKGSQLRSGVTVGFNGGYSAVMGVKNKNTNGFFKTVSTKSKSDQLNIGMSLGYQFAILPSFALGLETGVNYTGDAYNSQSATFIGIGPLKVKTSTTSHEVSRMNVPLLLTATYLTPINFSIFGKGGFSYNRYTDVGNKSNNTWGKFQPTVAGGIGYQIGAFNLFTEYTYVFGKTIKAGQSIDNQALSSQTISAGVKVTL